MLFPWYIKYPNQNDEILNLDWILSTIDNLVTEVANFVSLNTIKYADPIQWNITTQYEKNTVVIDPITGSAYISTQPVPAGVGLNNTDYWNIIFTLDVISANKNITLRDDANNMLATFESVVDDWLLWQGTLYIVTRDIDIGQAYVEGYNVSRYTVEHFLKDYITNLKSLLETELEEATGDLDDLETETKTNLVAAINEVLDTLSTKIGDLSDLTTTDKANLVEALNEVNNALGTIAGNIGDLDDLDTTDKDSIVEAINEVLGNLGALSTLDTTDKSSLVAAINEVLNDLDEIEDNRLEYIYVQDYLDLGQTPTVALRNAIADCPSKGTVIIPLTKQLIITDTITIDKPITVKGLSHGMNQLEGRNDNTPNSEYIKYDIKFTGGSIGFNILSPSVYIEDLVIRFKVAGDFKVFNLASQSGDTVNMPRDIRLKHVNVINEDYTGYNYTTYGCYSSQTVLLSTFEDVLFGWVTYGFSFENTSINTSLRFIRCNVSVKTRGYYISKGQYCYFIGCGCESPSNYGFYLENCKSCTILACFCEQITGTNYQVVSGNGVSIIGCFATTGLLIKTSISTGAIISCYSSTASSASNPWLSLYGSYMKLSGMVDTYVTLDNGQTTSRIGYSNKIVNYSSSSSTGFSASGCTIAACIWDVVDTHVHLTLELTATATAGTVTMPSYILPLAKKTIPMRPSGWATLNYQSNTIVLNFGVTGTFALSVDFESMAKQ